MPDEDFVTAVPFVAEEEVNAEELPKEETPETKPEEPGEETSNLPDIDNESNKKLDGVLKWVAIGIAAAADNPLGQPLAPHVVAEVEHIAPDELALLFGLCSSGNEVGKSTGSQKRGRGGLQKGSAGRHKLLLGLGKRNIGRFQFAAKNLVMKKGVAG